jgi:hypothetical protein
MKRRTRTDALRRRTPRLEPRARVLIVCEGEATEPGYFRSLLQELRARSVSVEIKEKSGVPKTLVERAVELKKNAERDAKREEDAGLRYDEVWCVFDRDHHPNLPAAFQQAHANGLHVAFSNPCFELWILLHFQDQRAEIETKAAGSACRKHLPRFTKHITYAELKERYAKALEHAYALEAWQASRENARGNPSTGVHHLAERLHQLGKPALLRALSR